MKRISTVAALEVKVYRLKDTIRNMVVALRGYRRVLEQAERDFKRARKGFTVRITKADLKRSSVQRYRLLRKLLKANGVTRDVFTDRRDDRLSVKVVHASKDLRKQLRALADETVKMPSRPKERDSYFWNGDMYWAPERYYFFNMPRRKEGHARI